MESMTIQKLTKFDGNTIKPQQLHPPSNTQVKNLRAGAAAAKTNAAAASLPV